MRRVAWPTRLILMLSFAVSVLAIAVAVVAFTGPSGGSPAVAGLVVASEEGDPTVSSGYLGGSSAEFAAALTADDPVSAGVEVACEQFRRGSTVKEVAAWFEDGWDGNRASAESVFRQIVEIALSEECPEVLP